jgi:hypothetical protein
LSAVTPPPDRPLALGELFAETIRIYGERVWAAFGLGAFTAAALVLGYATGHPVPFVVVLSLAFTAAFAAAARLVAGDEFREAWGQVALRVPTLLVLTVVVSVPFALGRIDPIILVFAVAWLAGTGFSIPVAVVERDESASTWFSRLGFALQRSLTLARAEFLHAMGVIAALVVVYYLLGVILAGALAGFADNSAAVATLLVQIVLAPFFFLGLAVLYFEQRARSSRRRSAG